MSAPWPDDLCANCPYSDMCDLDLMDKDGEPTGCRRVDDWRDDEERKAEGER